MNSRRREAIADIIWQHREIRFDLDPRYDFWLFFGFLSFSYFSHLRLIHGEHIIDRIDGVEDTKGNSGDKGIFRITNLRIIWHAVQMPRINLSIGFVLLYLYYINSSMLNLKLI